jgi:hypothetical protein
VCITTCFSCHSAQLQFAVHLQSQQAFPLHDYPESHERYFVRRQGGQPGADRANNFLLDAARESARAFGSARRICIWDRRVSFQSTRLGPFITKFSSILLNNLKQRWCNNIKVVCTTSSPIKYCYFSPPQIYYLKD